MLTPELVDALLAPISESSPAGDDLEYDPAFTALESSAQGKAEQQFGDTVIPAVEPDWRQVADDAQGLLGRSKDLRTAVLLLRAATRMQGIEGFGLGLQLLTGLLERYWEGIHPKLDADDDNDPTMRLNALAPLTDDRMLLRDLYDATVGNARGVGPIRVRDIAIAHNVLAPVGGEAAYSAAEIQGGLEAIHADAPATIESLRQLAPRIARLQSLIGERSGRGDAIDLSALRMIAQSLRKACASLGGVQAAQPSAEAQSDSPSAPPAATVAPLRGDIQSRQDALQMLDRVIHYLEQAEPGNPAPLLIARAKRLIGVSFLEIMAELAPNALDTIETVTGKPASG